MKEATLIAHIMAYLKTVPECHAEKMHGDIYAVAGRPDIIGCYQGCAFVIEAKVGDAQLRPSQQRQLQLWSDAGAFNVVARELEDAKRLIAAIDDWRARHV